MTRCSFHMSVQGASHIKKNKICQDAALSYTDEICSIAVVCDGHGGDDYIRSDIGAKIAAEVALTNIKDFVSNTSLDTMREKERIVALKQLQNSIIYSWNEKIGEHEKENPFTEQELENISEKAKIKYCSEDINVKRIESAYGTTLIAIVVTNKYWFGIQIGDGKCVSIDENGCFTQPIPWDEKCFLNATTSICDKKASENFRNIYSELIPVAIFIGSDGIDDSFKTEEQLYNLYKTVLYSFSTTEFDEAKKALEEYLPRLSLKGSGDDMSIGAILDLEKIKKLDIVQNYDTEKEKEKVQENIRKEKEKLERERRKFQLENDKIRIESEIQDGYEKIKEEKNNRIKQLEEEHRIKRKQLEQETMDKCIQLEREKKDKLEEIEQEIISKYVQIEKEKERINMIQKEINSMEKEDI